MSNEELKPSALGGAAGLLRFFHSQLGSTLVGVFLGIIAGATLTNYQVRRTEATEQADRLYAERVLLAEEISPWLLELSSNLPARGLNPDHLDLRVLEATRDSMIRFTELPRTTFLAERIGYAFGADVRTEYYRLIQMNAALTSFLFSLHGHADMLRNGTLVYLRSREAPLLTGHLDSIARVSFASRSDSIVDAATVPPARLPTAFRDSLARFVIPAMVDSIRPLAYEFGVKIRAAAFAGRPPQVQAAAGSVAVTCSSAEVLGTVILNGVDTYAHIEWGHTRELGDTAGGGGFSIGYGDRGGVWARLNDLTPKTTYYWRITASNPLGEAESPIFKFRTPPC